MILFQDGWSQCSEPRRISFCVYLRVLFFTVKRAHSVTDVCSSHMFILRQWTERVSGVWMCLIEKIFLYILKSEVIACPVCWEKIHRDQFRLDRGFRNDMQILIVICPMCNWTDLLKNYPVSDAFPSFTMIINVFSRIILIKCIQIQCVPIAKRAFLQSMILTDINYFFVKM